MSNVSQIPTLANTEEAWAIYCALADEYERNPKRRTDAEFCQRMARAHKRWLELFIKLDTAA